MVALVAYCVVNASFSKQLLEIFRKRSCLSSVFIDSERTLDPTVAVYDRLQDETRTKKILNLLADGFVEIQPLVEHGCEHEDFQCRVVGFTDGGDGLEELIHTQQRRGVYREDPRPGTSFADLHSDNHAAVVEDRVRQEPADGIHRGQFLPVPRARIQLRGFPGNFVEDRPAVAGVANDNLRKRPVEVVGDDAEFGQFWIFCCRDLTDQTEAE